MIDTNGDALDVLKIIGSKAEGASYLSADEAERHSVAG